MRKSKTQTIKASGLKSQIDLNTYSNQKKTDIYYCRCMMVNKIRQMHA